MKLAAKELRVSEPTEKDLAKLVRRPIYIVCDNILDTYNIGSIFRLADAVAVSKVYLCGASETPPNVKIARAAIGTEKWIPWEKKQTAKDAIIALKKEIPKIKIVAVEQGKGSVDFRVADFSLPIAFVLGHETTGVSKSALKLCDEIVEIPMFGVNKSLNVMVSLGVILYHSI